MSNIELTWLWNTHIPPPHTQSSCLVNSQLINWEFETKTSFPPLFSSDFPITRSCFDAVPDNTFRNRARVIVTQTNTHCTGVMHMGHTPPITIWLHCALDKVETKTSIKAAQSVSVQQVASVSIQLKGSLFQNLLMIFWGQVHSFEFLSPQFLPMVNTREQL